MTRKDYYITTYLRNINLFRLKWTGSAMIQVTTMENAQAWIWIKIGVSQTNNQQILPSLRDASIQD